MTGMDLATAQQYIEIAGGLEEAAELFFSGGSVEQAPAIVPNQFPSCASLLWADTLHESWKEQAITFSDKKDERIGIVQPKNGPCGVLAVIQAYLIANRLKDRKIDSNEPFSSKELIDALVQIISVCATNEASICTWETTIHNEKVITGPVALDKLGEVMEENISQFTGAGGLLLLPFSCIATRGESQVKQDALKNGELPLLYGPFSLCTSELLMLMLSGVADGSVGAYTPLGVKRQGDISIPSGVGLLSYQEFESGIPIHDILKSPKYPVWILHSGDNFTVLYSHEILESLVPPLRLTHWNGLPPGGPRLAILELQGDIVAGDAPETKTDSYCKPLPGEIEDIVQADPVDKVKYPEDWTRWKYEIVLAVEDNEVTGPERSLIEDPPEIFEQGEAEMDKPWRCSSCYRKRLSTWCFGANEAGATSCAHCNKPRAECGWTIWLPYSQLPSGWMGAMSRRYAPKIVSIIHTKWLDATVELQYSTLDATALPSV